MKHLAVVRQDGVVYEAWVVVEDGTATFMTHHGFANHLVQPLFEMPTACKEALLAEGINAVKPIR
jgi:hypothetical protein